MGGGVLEDTKGIGLEAAGWKGISSRLVFIEHPPTCTPSLLLKIRPMACSRESKLLNPMCRSCPEQTL